MPENNEIVTDLASNSSSSNLIVVGVSAAVGVVGTLAVMQLKKKLAERKAAKIELIEG